MKWILLLLCLFSCGEPPQLKIKEQTYPNIPWTNSGGNAQLNGRVDVKGPDSPNILWEIPWPTTIAWEPFIDNGRVFIIFQHGLPSPPDTYSTPVVCLDLETGQELWRRDIEALPTDWYTYILGVDSQKVYVSRGWNDQPSYVYALDQETGQIVWVTNDKFANGPYSGTIFSNGDIIVSEQRRLAKIDGASGLTLWESERLCAVSGNCGMALSNDGQFIYVIDAVPTISTAVKKYNANTGWYIGRGPAMPGMTIQNSPVVSTTGLVLVSRTQKNDSVDYLFAFVDSGKYLTQLWKVETGWTPISKLGIGYDGSIFVLNRDGELEHRDPSDGSLIGTSEGLSEGYIHLAIDVRDNIYANVTNQDNFDDSHLIAFDKDLHELWRVHGLRANIGGASLGTQGTLIFVDVNSIRAFR